MDIVILGSGNVATQLGKTLADTGYNISQIWSRKLANAKVLAELIDTDYTDRLDALNRKADLYIISVVDDAISDLLRQLTCLDNPLEGMVVHTSGSTPIEIFQKAFDNYGVFYPFQTFSKSKLVEFGKIPILVEASDKPQLDLLKNLAASISDDVRLASSAQRKSLHIAGVFACNYTNYLYSIAQQLLEENNLDFDLIRPLIKETADKVQLHAPKDVQTGPAIRKDLSILSDHMKFLEDKRKWQEIYKLLSDQLIALATKK